MLSPKSMLECTIVFSVDMYCDTPVSSYRWYIRYLGHGCHRGYPRAAAPLMPPWKFPISKPNAGCHCRLHAQCKLCILDFAHTLCDTVTDTTCNVYKSPLQEACDGWFPLPVVASVQKGHVLTWTGYWSSRVCQSHDGLGNMGFLVSNFSAHRA